MGAFANKPYARCTDARNPVVSRRPGWVLDVQDPIVFTAISTKKWALKESYENLFFRQRSSLSLVLSKVMQLEKRLSAIDNEVKLVKCACIPQNEHPTAYVRTYGNAHASPVLLCHSTTVGLC